LSRVSKLCPGCARKVQKNGYVRTQSHQDAS
jgi:hypothetical protein